ncbi:MAG: hydrogenase subunit MbhD domain-containing protein [Archaeoglobaceae archaeon]
MIVPIDLILLLFLILSAICVVVVKDLLSAVIVLGAYSFIMANIWLQLNAPDVAFTEAAVGAGIITAMMIATLSRLKKKDRYEKKVNKNLSSAVGLATILCLALIFSYAITDAPAFGDANSPSNRYVLLFKIETDYRDVLNSGKVPNEIKERIERFGFNKSNNFQELDQNYLIIRVENGWDVLVETYELYYHEPIKLYFIRDAMDKLEVYRYNWPTRVLEKTVEETAIHNAVTSGLADYRGYDTMFEEIVIFTAAVSVTLLVRRRGKL